MSGIQGNKSDRTTEAMPASGRERSPDVKKGGPVSQDYFLRGDPKKSGAHTGQLPGRQDRHLNAGITSKRPPKDKEDSTSNVVSSAKKRRPYYDGNTLNDAKNSYLESRRNNLRTVSDAHYMAGVAALIGKGKDTEETTRSSIVKIGKRLEEYYGWEKLLKNQ